MKKLEHLRIKAIELRRQGFSLPDICERLNRSKTTVYYWIKNVPIERPNAFLGRTKRKNKRAAKLAAAAIRLKHQKIHEEAKISAISEWKKLKNESGFCLFLMMYLCEGYKKTRHSVSVANSDCDLMKFAGYWMHKINYRNKPIHCRLQMHADQDEEEIVKFWESELSPDSMKVIRKSNSGKMSGRNWNSKHGVATLEIRDAYLKTKLDTWMDKLKQTLK